MLKWKSMERSPHYQEAIEKVRQLPQKTVAEKAEKKEQAQLLRMQILLDNAQSTHFLTQSLYENPTLTPQKLEDRVQDANLVVHPEATQRFIHEISFQQRDSVRKARSELAKQAARRKIPSAELLFKWAVSSKRALAPDWKPKGQLCLDDSFPLALILGVEKDADFKQIDQRKDVGGFYQKQLYYHYPREYLGQPITTLTSSFPLVAVKGLTEPQILAHEKAHAEHQPFRDALAKAERKIAWVQLYDQKKARISAGELQRKWDNNPAEALDSPEWESVLGFALAHAQDEILAEIGPENYSGISQHIKHLKERGELYDYFQNRLNIETNSPLYEDLWQNYEFILDEAWEAIRPILLEYESLALDERTELFRWVLAQIPLKDWSVQLERSLFVEEANRIGEINNSAVEYFVPEEYQEEGFYNPQRQKDYEKLRQRCQENQKRPLFEYLQEYEKKWVEEPS